MTVLKDKEDPENVIFTRDDGTFGWWDETWNDGDGVHYKTREEAVTAVSKYIKYIL